MLRGRLERIHPLFPQHFNRRYRANLPECIAAIRMQPSNESIRHKRCPRFREELRSIVFGMGQDKLWLGGTFQGTEGGRVGSFAGEPVEELFQPSGPSWSVTLDLWGM